MNDCLPLDVLCIGQACYDLSFTIPHQPADDEKIFADDCFGSGGGPAANAAVAISKLGLKAGFCGYLGQDPFGMAHQRELVESGVDTRFLLQSFAPTPLSTVLIKPNGQRSLINFKGKDGVLSAESLDFSSLAAKVLLFDGHQPFISSKLADWATNRTIPTVLDAGSVHAGTLALKDRVTYLVASEKFALQIAAHINDALRQLAAMAPVAVITLGERGLVWQRGTESGNMGAFDVSAIDTTGAGDAFHGAFAAGVASNMSWTDLLRYASAAGALCCTRIGARQGLPHADAIDTLLRRQALSLAIQLSAPTTE